MSIAESTAQWRSSGRTVQDVGILADTSRIGYSIFHVDAKNIVQEPIPCRSTIGPSAADPVPASFSSDGNIP